MKAGRIVALVIGCLLILPGIGMLIGGGVLSVAVATQRDDGGYFDADVDDLETPTVAITAEDLDLAADPGDADWLFDTIDADVRLRVSSLDSERAIFVGIGPAADVDEYLSGVARDQIRDFDDGLTPRYRRREGGDAVAPPTDQDFWVTSASGSGQQEITWEPESGRWAVVLMNADGSPGVAAQANIGVKSGLVVPVAVGLLVLGVILTVVAVVLIVVGATGRRDEPPSPPGPPGVSEAPAVGMPLAAPTPASVALAPPRPVADEAPSPVVVEAWLDPNLSRWMWLVKWFLAIPHYIVLAFLWLAFFVLTIVAGVAILFTGRYPRGIFDFNVGVLRWTWRVGYYATNGGLGTDRYPPFSLGPESDYPATLDVAYPEHLSRGLVLVKWWLLVLPQYLVVGVFVGTVWSWTTLDGDNVVTYSSGGGLLGILVLIAAVILLFRGRYPLRLFELVIGINRWIYRVVAYAALMTDRYPPFQLDQGGSEPGAQPPISSSTRSTGRP